MGWKELLQKMTAKEFVLTTQNVRSYKHMLNMEHGTLYESMFYKMQIFLQEDLC